MSFEEFVNLAEAIVRTESRDYIKTIIVNAGKEGFSDSSIIDGFDKAVKRTEHLYHKHKADFEDVESALKSYDIMLDIIKNDIT